MTLRSEKRRRVSGRLVKRRRITLMVASSAIFFVADPGLCAPRIEDLGSILRTLGYPYGKSRASPTLIFEG